MIVTDLDGTLLDRNKQITSYTTGILERCREKRIFIIFATARPKRAAEGFLSAFHPDYIIGDNGAAIDSPGGSLYRNPIPQEEARSLLSELKSSSLVTYITAEAGDCVYTNYTGEEWGKGWNPVYSDFTTPPDYDTVKISAECADKDFLYRLMEAYPDLRLYPNSGENWYQITRSNSTKLSAIRFLTQEHGIDICSVAAFGDDYNDVEMLRECGFGVAVVNAVTEVREAAAYICDSHTEDGVARWLESNVLRLASL